MIFCLLLLSSLSLPPPSKAEKTCLLSPSSQEVKSQVIKHIVIWFGLIALWWASFFSFLNSSHGNELKLEVRWGCVLGALLKHPWPFNERPTLSASQRSPLCVDVFDGGPCHLHETACLTHDGRAFHYKRLFAPLPALLPLIASPCSQTIRWGTALVTFLTMSPWIVISVRQLDGWLALKLLRNLSGMNPIGFQTPLRFLLPPPWEWYFSFFSEIFGQLVDILHRNLL